MSTPDFTRLDLLTKETLAKAFTIELLRKADDEEGETRFEKLKNKLSKDEDVDDPAAVAASIGRKKYGAKKFAEMGAAGKKKG